MTAGPSDDLKKPAGQCPLCGRATEHAFRPFCSKRCADVDLARWLTGAYAIAGGDSDADEDGDDAAAQARPASSDPDRR